MTEIATLAQTSAPGGGAAAPKQGTDSLLRGPLVPMVLVLVVFYLFMFRSKKSQDKQRQDMLGKMKRGDRVQTIGGILGTVVEARDNDVLVKVDEGNNTKIKFTRSAIHRIVEEEKAESK